MIELRLNQQNTNLILIYCVCPLSFVYNFVSYGHKTLDIDSKN